MTIDVEDDGPGMSEARRLELLGGPSDHIGRSGLGLVIARGVAEAHGGRLALGASTDGGLRVTLTLPGARAGALAELPGSTQRPFGASAAS